MARELSGGELSNAWPVTLHSMAFLGIGGQWRSMTVKLRVGMLLADMIPFVVYSGFTVNLFFFFKGQDKDTTFDRAISWGIVVPKMQAQRLPRRQYQVNQGKHLFHFQSRLRPAVLAWNPSSAILATVSGMIMSRLNRSCCNSSSALSVGPGYL